MNVTTELETATVPNQTSRFDPTGSLADRLTLLEASAGTGKTYCITDLFLRLITEPEWTAHGPDEAPVQAREVLVVTFTEAATAEMRERIRLRLRAARDGFERAQADGHWWPERDKALSYLIKQGREKGSLKAFGQRVGVALNAFDEITISTIHGFCQRMLMRNAFESGTEFNTELLTDLNPLIEQVVLDFWVRTTHAVSLDLLALMTGNALGGLKGLLRIAKLVIAYPDLKLLPQDGPEFDEEAWASWVRKTRELAERWFEERDAVKGVLVRACCEGILNKNIYNPGRIRNMVEDMAALLARISCGNPDLTDKDSQDVLAFFGRAKVVTSTLKGKTPPELPPFFDLAQQIHDEAQTFLPHRHAFLMDLRRRFALEVQQAIPRLKLQRHVQGFDDLLRRLRDGLQKEPNCEALRSAIGSQYRVAIIDEFQDTDPIQWDIFNAVFGHAVPEEHRKLWLVGDPKQAIYSFRQADIDTYLRAKSSPGMQCQRLDTNYRSDAPLVGAVNALFGRKDWADPFLKKGIVYEPVKAERDTRWQRPSILTWKRPFRMAFLGHGEKEKGITKDSARQRICSFVASDILELLSGDGKMHDDHTGALRPIEPGDVAVLVRTHHEGRDIERALQRVGIPCVRRTQESVFDSDEAGELRRLLQAVLNPGDRNAMLSALATAILGVQASQMSDIEIDAISADPWHARLEAWSRIWNQDGFMRMFRTVMMNCDVVRRVIQREGGERRVTNLLHLAELIHDASKRKNLGPEGALAWLARQTGPGDGEQEADARLLRLESDARAVKIVTIHLCKGLQYPFVWCPFLWDGKLLHGTDFPKFHDGDRIAAHLASKEEDVDPYQESVAKAEVEILAENMRLAYVAVTRAIHATTLVTGGISGFHDSALGILLHHGRAFQALLTPDERMKKSGTKPPVPSDRKLQDDLDALVAASAAMAEDGQPTIGWFEIPDRPEAAARYCLTDNAVAPLEAEAFEPWRQLDPAWHWNSFTGMTKKTHDQAALEAAGTSAESGVNGTLEDKDYDTELELSEGQEEGREEGSDEAAPPTPTTSSDQTPDQEVPLDTLPRGRVVGELLHKIFEVLDFATCDDCLIRDTIGEHSAALGVQIPDVPALTAGLRRVLDTPLDAVAQGQGRALRLRDLAWGDTLRELEFVFPVAGGFDARPHTGSVNANDLVAAFGVCRDAHVNDAYLQRLGNLGFGGFRGFLNGSIDLAFRQRPDDDAGDDRWYIVDYKSNRLPRGRKGPGRYRDYVPAALNGEMAHAHYLLQYHLYLVALHRYLRLRQKDYDYDRHIGGVFYLFVRGMQGESPVGDSGVFRDRPPKKRIEALSCLFDRAALQRNGEVAP